MIDREKKIYIGNIIAPHGIKGEFKVRIDDQYASYIINSSPKINFYSKEGNVIKLHLKRMNEKFVIAKIEDINDRTAAEAYAKTGIYCDIKDLPALEDDEFYYSDLINKKVVNAEGQEIGVVINILNFGAGDIIEIKTLDGKREMHPFNKKIFPNVEADSIKLMHQD